MDIFTEAVVLKSEDLSLGGAHASKWSKHNKIV